jgi:hypothetical protein
MDAYKVFIPTAGTGTRLGGLTKFVNKSLVTIANKPTISHIIEKFSYACEFVIALGHKGHLVCDFLEMAYPDRHFTFFGVNPYEGDGSGLGLSVLACESALREPFIFISCDTLVDEDIPAPDTDWMGYADRPASRDYRSLDLGDGLVRSVLEKKDLVSSNCRPYIGLAGINDYKLFWQTMRAGGSEAIALGESFGLKRLVADGRVEARPFHWHDTGTLATLAEARASFPNDDINILEKENEAIWFVGPRVIKFSDDRNFIAERVKRAVELEGFVPRVVASAPNMYSYLKIPGQVFSRVVNWPRFEALLDFSKTLWTLQELSKSEKIHLKTICLDFYRDKTIKRIDLFFEKFGRYDLGQPVNGLNLPPIKNLLDRLDWDWLTNGLFGRFHGDFHFENILYNQGQFIFLDWRQNFGGSLSIGDIYYDLAKLLHGLIVSHEQVAHNEYHVQWSDNEINFDLLRKQSLVECEKRYLTWLDSEGYDRRKVLILTALVFLNIAALHHYPYSLMLFALGKYMLGTSIKVGNS